MKCPCVIDCPDRTAECRKTCEKWKTYEAWKFQDYARREEEGALNGAMIDMAFKRYKRHDYWRNKR